MDERKRLYKSRNNKMICGVCAGIADYFNIDPSIVRVLWAVLALAAGTGVLAYIACAIILPEGDTEVRALDNPHKEDILNPVRRAKRQKMM